MGEKKEVKIKFSSVICVIVIILLLAGCGALYYLGFIEKDKKIAELENKVATAEQNPQNTQKEEQKTEENRTIKKLDDRQDLVYQTNGVESEMFSYAIPMINIDSPDVKEINREINDRYGKMADEVLQTNNDEELVDVIEYRYIGYDRYVNDNILSLVIEESPGYDYSTYEVYNVDIYTGKKVSNSEILASKNLSESDFLEKAKTDCVDYFKALYKSATGEAYIEDEFYKEQLEKTSNMEHSVNVSMFLNLEGKLCIIELIPSLAGAEAYYRIVNLGI